MDFEEKELFLLLGHDPFRHLDSNPKYFEFASADDKEHILRIVLIEDGGIFAVLLNNKALCHLACGIVGQLREGRMQFHEPVFLL